MERRSFIKTALMATGGLILGRSVVHRLVGGKEDVSYSFRFPVIWPEKYSPKTSNRPLYNNLFFKDILMFLPLHSKRTSVEVRMSLN